jgi:hypothetical protein
MSGWGRLHLYTGPDDDIKHNLKFGAGLPTPPLLAEGLAAGPDRRPSVALGGMVGRPAPTEFHAKTAWILTRRETVEDLEIRLPKKADSLIAVRAEVFPAGRGNRRY